MARGEFIGFFHDHDMHVYNFVQRCVQLMLIHPRVGLVGAGWRMEDDKGNFLGERRSRNQRVEKGWKYIERTIRSGRSSVAIPGAFMRRIAVGEHRLGGAKGFGDFPLWFRIAEKWEIGHEREVLWTMRQSADAQSATTIIQMTEDYLKNIGDYLADLKKRHPNMGLWIERRQKDARKFVYWALVYEWLLHLQPQSAKGEGSTLFQIYGYRITDEQKDKLRKMLIESSPAYLFRMTRYLVGTNPNSLIIRLAAIGIKYPNFMRKILNAE
jgi:hypothetical protein